MDLLRTLKLGSRAWKTTVECDGGTMEVECTRRARKALLQRSSPLLVEMVTTIGCMAKKAVTFREQVVSADEAVFVDDTLALRLKTRVLAAPSMVGGDDPSNDAKPFSVLPSSLRIDYRRGSWEGEYTL